MPKPKTLTLNFVEYASYKSDTWNPETHIAARIEILESDKEYHTEEIEIRLPAEIYYALREKLDLLEIKLLKVKTK